MDACLLIFTKPAVPGRVKTRLIGAVTAEVAAELHAAFLADLVARLAGGRFDLRLLWALEPGEALPAYGEGDRVAPDRVAGDRVAGDRLESRRQEGADLGARLHAALADAARDHAVVAAVGSDHPDLSLATVESALAAVAGGAPAVFGPASDGGYYLVALAASAVAPELFTAIDWSTERVLAQSLERCRARGIEPQLLAPGDDVDTPADLARLAVRLAAHPALCPRTCAILDRLPELAHPVLPPTST